MDRRRSAGILLVATLTTGGCGPNWQSIATIPPRPLNGGTVVEFHAKGEVVRLHGVRFEQDSVSGIPWLEHLSCETCRIRFALADVEDPRTGDPGAGAWNILVPFALVFGGLYAIFRSLPRD